MEETNIKSPHFWNETEFATKDDYKIYLEVSKKAEIHERHRFHRYEETMYTHKDDIYHFFIGRFNHKNGKEFYVIECVNCGKREIHESDNQKIEKCDCFTKDTKYMMQKQDKFRYDDGKLHDLGREVPIYGF